MLYRYRTIVASLVVGLAVAGTRWGAGTEKATWNGPDYLCRVAAPYRGWAATEVPLAKSDLALLQPDAVLSRRYRSPRGAVVDLVVIAGHRKRTVHTPGYCMVGGGWDVVSQQPHELMVEGEAVPATRAVLARAGHQLVATYFFTDGALCTPNVVAVQWASLLRRAEGRLPLTALVRIIVPVTTDEAAAGRLSDEFAGATLPAVLRALRSARQGKPGYTAAPQTLERKP